MAHNKDLVCEQELLHRLENGDFSYISLNSWFERKEFWYIEATLDGCDKVISECSSFLFNSIVTYAEYLLLKSTSEEDISDYEVLLKKAIIIASKHDEYKHYVEQLFYSTNDRVRLYCYANLNLDDKIKLIQTETNERIRKVYYLRTISSGCLKMYEPEVHDRIKWFKTAIETETLECVYDNCDNEFTPVNISSLIFEDEVHVLMDTDVIDTIEDKTIFAYCLNEMYEEGILRFKESVRLPQYFKNSTIRKHVRARVKEYFNLTDKKNRFQDLYKVQD